MVSEFDTFLDNVVDCKRSHFNCLQNEDKICEKSFGRCVGKYPMVTNSTMRSLGVKDDHLLYRLIPDKWKNGISNAKNAIKNVIGKGKQKLVDMIKKGRVKIKEIIEKIETKIPDIIETIKTLPQMMGKIPAKLKCLLEKIKAIPSIVYKNVKGAVEFCQKRRIEECIFGSTTAAKLVCDLKYPVCVPAYLSCNTIAGNVIKICEHVIFEMFGNWLIGETNEVVDLISGMLLTPFLTIAQIFCAGPSFIASGCILTA